MIYQTNSRKKLTLYYNVLPRVGLHTSFCFLIWNASALFTGWLHICLYMSCIIPFYLMLSVTSASRSCCAWFLFLVYSSHALNFANEGEQMNLLTFLHFSEQVLESKCTCNILIGRLQGTVCFCMFYFTAEH